MCAEVLLRVTGLAYPGGVATMTEQQFQRLPGIYAPDQEVLSRDVPALTHHVRIDSLGFRGPDFPRSKAPGEFRVLFTGDSFTYGSYVDDSVTVPMLLQEELGRGCESIRVINAGLGGSTITDQARIVERGRGLEPNLVLVMFSENDVADLEGEPMWDRLAANRARKSRFPASLMYAALRHTAIWNLVLKARARMAAGSGLALAPSVGPDGGRLDVDLRRRYSAVLASLQSTVEARGIPLAFAAMPTHLTANGNQLSEQYDWVNRLADSLGLLRPDILAHMRSTRDTTALYLLPFDGHTSPAGNRIAASAIAGALLRLPQVAAVCAGVPPARAGQP